MEAIGEQLAEYCGSTAVLTRAGSVSSRGSEASDGGPGLGFAGRLRAVPALVRADADQFLPAPLPAESIPVDNPSSLAQPLAAAPLPTGNPAGADEPLSLSEIGGLLAAAAAAAPSRLAGADYVEAADFAGQVEDLSRSVEYLQVLSAGIVDRTRAHAIAAADASRAGRSRTGKGWVTGWHNGAETLNETDTAWPEDTGTSGSMTSAPGSQMGSDRSNPVITSPADDGCANTAEFLRLRLRIGKSEAHRRLALAADILPTNTLTGDILPATREHLAAALTPTPPPAPAGSNVEDEDTPTSGAATSPVVSSRAGTIIALTLNRLRHLVTPERLALIEENLTTTAATTDPDFLTRLARRWADTIDADGTEPSEEALRHTQGAFIHKPRHGLHHLEIFATTDQYEHLLTVMNTATNPRTTTTNTGTGGGSGAGARAGAGGVPGNGTGQDSLPDGDVDLDRRTRPQKQLDGIIGAVKTAMATNTLPTTGGNRPQIIATINYQDLLPHPRHVASETGTGNFAFTGPVTAATIRKIACDADIIPALLGTHSEILDLGRKTRLFTPTQRQALTARDQGCTFPNCTIPAPWCEAHHITYWSHGGPTTPNNGTLLCSAHHHLIHKEQWTIITINNTPWYTPPKHLDPHQKPQQNTYFKPPPPPQE
ncbi:HNH endonuclease signature motif containing protein [Arthrobacter sp. D3-16]